MKWFFALTLLGTVLAGLSTAQSNPNAPKAKTVKSTGPALVKKGAAGKSIPGHPSPQLATARATTSRRFVAAPVSNRREVPGTHTASRRIVTRRMVHGHWVRVTRVVHIAPAVILPQHPDPDRYQEIQKALADRGYFKGEPNGQWNDDSVDAFKRFQTDQNLPADGKISSLALIGLGLGPKHDGTAAIPPPAPISTAPPAPSDIPDSVPAPKYVTAQPVDQSAAAAPKKPQ